MTEKKATPPSKATPSFQDRLEELSGLVEELESGSLPLEEAIRRFEAGQAIHKRLLSELEGYEKRIEKLVKDGEGQDRVTNADEDIDAQ